MTPREGATAIRKDFFRILHYPADGSRLFEMRDFFP